MFRKVAEEYLKGGLEINTKNYFEVSGGGQLLKL